MPCNYKKICQDNIRRRGDEFDDIGHLISEQLYSDRSHFVYELLQNAEDALERRLKERPDDDSCRRVRFRLFQDRLEFRHFGVSFNEADVKGISDVLKGTKEEDPVQIGKFGIGFKSVYAFTASPEIHSGEEHFTIKRYIRPEEKEIPPDLSTVPDETVFIFPFDHKDLSADHAFDLILNKLRRLGPRVLLFLRQIDEIEWSIEPDGEKGHYLKEIQRENKSVCRIAVIGQKSGQDEEENWLLFERPVTVPNESYEVRVEVGFWLETDTKNKMERSAKINDTGLVVYFPTDKATRLGFLIQGPYRTNPARDNVPEDDDWNKMLVEETAELVAESLESLKNMGLLSVSLLEALPIRTGDFQEGGMFYPIFSRVRKALLNEKLLPASDGTFVTAQDAKLARGTELAKLLGQESLNTLFRSNGKTKWLTEQITQNLTPDLHSYLMKELNIEEVDPQILARKLSGDFLSTQTDEWFIQFYNFLVEQKALWRPPYRERESGGVLRHKPILRLENGSHVKPFGVDNSPNASIADEKDADTSLPVVKIQLSKNKEVQRFLYELGIPKLDIVEEVVKEVLPKYTTDKKVPDKIHMQDIAKIERAYKTDSQEKKNRLRRELLETSFILSKLPNGEKDYRKPDQVYFETEELGLYFSRNDSYGFVAFEYPESIRALLGDLGVMNSVRVERKENNSRGHVIIEDRRGWHQRGINGFDPNIRIDGLKNALDYPSTEKSAFIWNKIAAPHSDCICGTVESSGRQTYEDSWKNSELSKDFGRLLTENAWLPDSDGHFHKPSDLTLDDLPESFDRDEKLADQLGMKKNVVAKLADEFGVKQETIQLAKELEEHPDKLEEVRKFLTRKEENQKPAFPSRPVNNLQRRQERLSEQYRSAPIRSIRREKEAFEPHEERSPLVSILETTTRTTTVKCSARFAKRKCHSESAMANTTLRR